MTGAYPSDAERAKNSVAALGLYGNVLRLEQRIQKGKRRRSSRAKLRRHPCGHRAMMKQLQFEHRGLGSAEGAVTPTVPSDLERVQDRFSQPLSDWILSRQHLPLGGGNQIHDADSAAARIGSSRCSNKSAPTRCQSHRSVGRLKPALTQRLQGCTRHRLLPEQQKRMKYVGSGGNPGLRNYRINCRQISVG